MPGSKSDACHGDSTVAKASLEAMVRDATDADADGVSQAIFGGRYASFAPDACPEPYWERGAVTGPPGSDAAHVFERSASGWPHVAEFLVPGLATFQVGDVLEPGDGVTVAVSSTVVVTGMDDHVRRGMPIGDLRVQTCHW